MSESALNLEFGTAKSSDLVKTVEIQKNAPGYAHSHRAGKFHFTPLKAGDTLVDNFKLSAERIQSAAEHPVFSLNGLREGADLDAVCPAGVMFNAEEGGHERAASVALVVVLREGYAVEELPRQSAMGRTFRIVPAPQPEK
jgi:hypothetical protein